MPPQQNQPDLVNFFDTPAALPNQQPSTVPVANNPFAAFTTPNPVAQPPPPQQQPGI